MKLRKFIYFIVLYFSSFVSFSQNIIVFGKVTDSQNRNIENVAVAIKGTSTGTTTNKNGEYQIQISPYQKINIVFSYISYQKTEITFIPPYSTNRIEKNVVLIEEPKQIDQIQITDKKISSISIIRIDPKIIDWLPNISGSGIESIIKTMPGVSSNNELSSQYNVRGGNFDENLVYVNDIEIYRPFLMRSGQQEGLSFINSEMVSAISFSAGGFDAKYDDKMSSVLDIKYKQPKDFAISANASFLGASMNIEGASKNSKFSYINGIRYKTSQYILSSLDVHGDYNPSFFDLQSFFSYRFSKKFEIGFLANYAHNKYNFIPEDRSTSFGTLNNALNLFVDFDGKEIDKYSSFTGALSFDFQPSDKMKLKFITSLYQTDEQETFDIKGKYMLNELDKQYGSSQGDSLMNLGIGAFLQHARNFLKANVLSFNHKGYLQFKKNLLQWGIKYQHEYINDKINEWTLMDSAGYSIPYNGNTIQLANIINSKNILTSNRYTAYIQNNYSTFIDSTEINITAGFRNHYWDYNKQFLISPRLSVAIKPNWKKNITFRFSTGLYYQPPFYRELRNIDGKLTFNKKAQESIHFVIGSDYTFKAWGRPFKLTGEIYYKYLDNLIPYQVDNIRIQYYSNLRAKGYATGIDLKINGEFVEGAESWASVSIMQAKEKIIGTNTGYIPRPTDQLINVGIFFQDYVPGYKSFKMNLNVLYGWGLPFGPPNRADKSATLRMPSYKRVDIGFSAVLKNENKLLSKENWFRNFKSIWISLEVFNLLDVNNTISYFWITVVPNTTNINAETYNQYAVPNRLTSRRLNIKISFRI